MRILTDEQAYRVYNHFYIDYSSHKYIAKSFKAIDGEMVMSFVLKYIKPTLQHFKVIEYDVADIVLAIKKGGIKKPIF